MNTLTEEQIDELKNKTLKILDNNNPQEINALLVDNIGAINLDEEIENLNLSNLIFIDKTIETDLKESNRQYWEYEFQFNIKDPLSVYYYNMSAFEEKIGIEVAFASQIKTGEWVKLSDIVGFVTITSVDKETMTVYFKSKIYDKNIFHKLDNEILKISMGGIGKYIGFDNKSTMVSIDNYFLTPHDKCIHKLRCYLSGFVLDTNMKADNSKLVDELSTIKDKIENRHLKDALTLFISTIK